MQLIRNLPGNNLAALVAWQTIYADLETPEDVQKGSSTLTDYGREPTDTAVIFGIFQA
jgi:hypothetical protein